MLKLPGIIRRFRGLLSSIILIMFFYSFFCASRDIVEIYLKFKSRSEYILLQREKGITDIYVEAPICTKNKHVALYGLDDMNENWVSQTIARYYGMHSIRIVEK